jgi:hypothetical protein
MDEEWLIRFEKEHRDLPDARVEAELERWLPDTAPRKILLDILSDRRAGAAAAEKERFEQSYSQTERHHTEQIAESRRQSRRAELVAWVALVTSALALWLQYGSSGRDAAQQAKIPASPIPLSSSPAPTSSPNP